jgi:hypothetical protein
MIPPSVAQSTSIEKSFPQSSTAVEKALRATEPSLSGSLPMLDGFARSDRPLDQYQRAFYKCIASVVSSPSGGSRVRMAAKITAWYSDPAPSKSGYRELPSNGRLEADCLDRLSQSLKDISAQPAAGTASSNSEARRQAVTPMISAPTPGGSTLADAIAESKTPMKASSPPSSADPGGKAEGPSVSTQKAVADRRIEELTREAKNLQEILHNQSHPDNLVAVKKAGTPVLMSPSEGAKVLFLADAEDEFEILDKNAAWVHVRISGLSRGWIRRANAELPDTTIAGSQKESGEPGDSADPSKALLAGSAPFQVENEQTSFFPGNWAPLRGKTVRIISVQKTNPRASGDDAKAKLDFAKALLVKEYAQLAGTDTITAGLVVIFDSEDGGMLAATLAVLQEWKSGTLSDEAFWRRCFFDPPDAFRVAGNP